MSDSGGPAKLAGPFAVLPLIGASPPSRPTPISGRNPPSFPRPGGFHAGRAAGCDLSTGRRSRGVASGLRRNSSGLAQTERVVLPSRLSIMLHADEVIE